MPGIRSNAPGISPAKIAVATVVTITAIAGTGSIKNVNGINSAVAIVAVKPGIAPTNRPKIAAISIKPSVCGSAIRKKALIIVSIASYHATGKRMPQGSGTSNSLANRVCMTKVVTAAIRILLVQLDPKRINKTVRISREIGTKPSASDARI